MYFFKHSSGAWVLGENLTDFISEGEYSLVKNSSNVFSIATITGTPLRTLDVLTTKKNVNGELYSSVEEFINVVSDFFYKAPVSGGEGSGGIEEILYSDLKSLIDNNNLIANKTYKIIDRGDRGIIVTVVSTNQLELESTRIMLCPTTYSVTTDEYNNVWKGVWNQTIIFAVDELTIWNGQVWKCIVEVTEPLNPPDLNAVNWVLIPKESFTNHEYIEMIFGCIYDISNDWIAKQWDENGNIFGMDYQMENNPDYGYMYGFNLCDYSDWNFATSGYKFNKNNCQGIYNNSNVEEISENTNLGIIFNNFNCGGITKNSNTGSIYNNSNGGVWNNRNNGDIADNTNSGSIYDNANFGDIILNSNDGSINGNLNLDKIYQNSNSGDIVQNTILGWIRNNSNAGTISYNSNAGNISNNTNIGMISNNLNNGYISGCTSTVSVNIYNNINNGNISGFWPSDVTDSKFDKGYSAG